MSSVVKGVAVALCVIIFVFAVPIGVFVYTSYLDKIAPDPFEEFWNNRPHSTAAAETDASDTEALTTAAETDFVPGFDYLGGAGGRYELPVTGAAGYASVETEVLLGPVAGLDVIGTLEPGQGFTVLEESGAWWRIKTDELEGWVVHWLCFINLPDIIPSIVYNDTNAKSSVFVSSGKDIPGITGEKLYNAYAYNERLGKDEYILPVLYSMAAKINIAQQSALAEGNTLVIYEGFRPYDVQNNVSDTLGAFASTDQTVRAGISSAPWSAGWFIASGVSNHQKGYAIDVNLAKVTAKEEMSSGDYVYTDVTGYEEYEMPTALHELSYRAAVYTYPVSPDSDTAWRTAPLTASMNEWAILLQKYCTDAGLTPLASEWWHFNDLTLKWMTDSVDSNGKYRIETAVSEPPLRH